MLWSFSQACPVSHVKRLPDKTGNWPTSRTFKATLHDAACHLCVAGCAFVTFERWSQAEAAIEAINGRTQLDGAKAAIVVKFADAKTPGGQMLGMGGGGGGGGGFQDMSGGMKRSFGGSPEYMPNKKTSQGMGMMGGMGGYNNNNNRMGGGYDNGMGYGMMGGMVSQGCLPKGPGWGGATVAWL